jgi:zinc transporter 1
MYDEVTPVSGSINDIAVEISPLLTSKKYEHSHEAHEHGHSHKTKKHKHSHGSRGHTADKIKMGIMLFLVFLIFCGETAMGIYLNSLTLVSDALHMFSDFLSLIIGLIALMLARKPRSATMSFGWGRLETLGGFTNGIFLVSVVIFIYHEAITRFIEPHEITDKPYIILAMGGAGLCVNLFGIMLFCGHAPHAGHDHSHGHKHENHNMMAIFIHIVGDFLGSIGVMVSAGLIWAFPPEKHHWSLYVDPAASTLMATVILLSAIPLLVKCAKVLIQGVPVGINLDKLTEKIKNVEGVQDVHELHVWKLVNNRNVGSMHVKCTAIDFISIAPKVQNIMHKYGVHSTTIQPEFVEQVTMAGCNLRCDEDCKEHWCCPEEKH